MHFLDAQKHTSLCTHPKVIKFPYAMICATLPSCSSTVLPGAESMSDEMGACESLSSHGKQQPVRALTLTSGSRL